MGCRRPVRYRRASAAGGGGGVLLVLWWRAAAGVLVGIVGAAGAHAATVTVRTDQRFQVMDGFGASAAFYENWLTAYPTAAKQQLYDALFHDTGMTILRVRIYPNLWPSSTSALSWDWSVHQREIIAAARQRGVTTIWATCWSPPAWMKDNGSLNGGNLRTDRYPDYAMFITSYVVGMRDLYGIPIAGVSLFNEPGFATSYDSTLTSPDAYRDVLRVVGAFATARGIAIPFFCCETMDINNTTWGALGRGYIPTLLADTTAAALTDRIITHQYGDIDRDRWHELATLAQAHGKPVWQTEMSQLTNATHDIAEALEICHWIWIAITSGNAAAWHYWQYFWPYDPNAAEGLVDIYNPWSGDGSSGRFDLPKRYHGFRQWTRHVRPGHVRVGCTSDDPRIQVAAFTGSSTAVIVAFNRTASTIPVVFQGAGAVGVVQHLRTTATEDYALQPPIGSTAGAFAVTMLPRSIATFSFFLSTGALPNQAPTVFLTSPPNNSTYTAPAAITLSATASDPDGTIAAVRFYVGTTLLFTDTSSPYSYSWTGVSSGTYQLSAVATDNQGGTGMSGVVTVTVVSSWTPVNQPPVVTLTSPVDGSTYPAPATILLAATASDSDGQIINVRFYRGGTLLGSVTASPYEYAWVNVSSGTYQLRAVAQDNAGGTSTSTIVTVTVLSRSTPEVTYTLTVTQAVGGTVSQTPSGTVFSSGTVVSLTASPDAGYVFVGWSGAVTSTSSTITVVMDADKSVTASFQEIMQSPVQPVLQPGEVRVVGGAGGYVDANISPTVSIQFRRQEAGVVIIRIYDLRGRMVYERKKNGPANEEDAVVWNVDDIPAGVYVVVVNGAGTSRAVRCALLR